MTDFLVIGSGLAGLHFALKAAEFSCVKILTKAEPDSANSPLAQGGIAAVTSKTDDFEKHIQDTISAGAGLCQKEAVNEAVRAAPERIAELIKWGVKFDSHHDGSPSLTKEGGHSKRRILHMADHTGKDLHTHLLKLAINHPNIEISHNRLALELITSKKFAPFKLAKNKCHGAYVLNKNTDEVYIEKAKAVILACGGAGKAYLYTSNWDGATGDGIAMAYRAGARLANLEFMQFHPTCLYHPQARNFLISEALRGEGAELINSDGVAFMKQHHPMGSLAPRDIVARSIDNEIKKTGADCVYLDISHKENDFIKKRFPLIHSQCKKLGLDISNSPIPVVPAAHYLCGGVITNIHGETDIEALYAVGETACTGLHGANRLASNSLLECLVFSHNAAESVRAKMKAWKESDVSLPAWRHGEKPNADEVIVVSYMWDEIRRLMWNYVGIVRSDRRLQRAQHRLQNIQQEIREYYSEYKTHSDVEELRNIALIAELTVQCALKRKESRGIHFSLDYTETSSNVKDSVVSV